MFPRKKNPPRCLGDKEPHMNFASKCIDILWDVLISTSLEYFGCLDLSEFPVLSDFPAV